MTTRTMSQTRADIIRWLHFQRGFTVADIRTCMNATKREVEAEIKLGSDINGKFLNSWFDNAEEDELVTVEGFDPFGVKICREGRIVTGQDMGRILANIKI